MTKYTYIFIRTKSKFGWCERSKNYFKISHGTII